MSSDIIGNIISFEQLVVPQTSDEVNRVADKYGIDISGYNVHLRMDEDLLDVTKGYTGGAFENNEIDLYPLAFINEETLARTLFHEAFHQKQYAKYGYDNIIVEHMKYENITRNAENKWWENKEWQK